MPSSSDIARIFNRFASHEISMKETWIDDTSDEAQEKASRMGPGFFKRYLKIEPDRNDPTLRDLLSTARAHGLDVFLMYPRHTVAPHPPFCREDSRDDRVRVFLDKGTDGKWRINPKFVVR